MNTCVLDNSIYAKEKNFLILQLEELSLIRFVQIKYQKSIDVIIKFAIDSKGKWIYANKHAKVAHSLSRNVKTGCLPANFVSIEFIGGDIRHLIDFKLLGISKTSISELKSSERELHFEKPLEIIY